MCKFVSWKEFDNEVYFLTRKDLETKRFKEFQKFNPNWQEDIVGHGAVEFFYPELVGKGEPRECSDFSTPANFPKEIVEAIKQGQFEGIGICPDILRASAWKTYKEAEASAWEAYQKVRAEAWEAYRKVIAAAFWAIAKEPKNRKKIWR